MEAQSSGKARRPRGKWTAERREQMVAESRQPGASVSEVARRNGVLAQLSKKSPLAGAIHHALSRWKALTRYSEDGRIEIDNNAAERSLRTVALGRKNYLFEGSGRLACCGDLLAARHGQAQRA